MDWFQPFFFSFNWKIFGWNNCLIVINFGMMILRKTNCDIIWYSVIFAVNLYLSIFVWTSDILNFVGRISLSHKHWQVINSLEIFIIIHDDGCTLFPYSTILNSINLPLLSEENSLMFLITKLLYKIKCPSVCLSDCMSVCPSGLGGNVIFSAPNWNIARIIFCADSPHKWASIL